MKRFILKLLPFLLIIAAMLTVPMMIDPFNVFHADKIRYTGVEPNKNYIKTRYILKNPDKFDAFAFGSSRVGMLHFEKVEDVKCYNMTRSGGIPSEDLNTVKTMLSHGIVPKRIYLGIDSISYTFDAADRTHDPLRVSYEQLSAHPLDIVELYCDPEITGKAVIEVMLDPPEAVEEYGSEFYEYGSYVDYIGTTYFSESKANPISGQKLRIDETVEDIKSINELCEQYGIEFILFTNPMNPVNYSYAVEELDYFDFLKKTAQVKDFYNFSGLNDRTTDYSLFYDTSHFIPETGDMMLYCMTDGRYPVDKADKYVSKEDEKAYYEHLRSQGFGYYVTADNAGDFLELLAGQMIDKREADNTNG